MTHQYADIAFTDTVKAAQKSYGSRERNQRLQDNYGPNDEFTANEAEFILQRDSFYLATVGETDWPYVQHRGGPVGFLKLVDPRHLAYADFRGNTQLISVGNLQNNDRCSLFLMDYHNRRRLKILGHMQVQTVEDSSEALKKLVELPNYKARVERIVTIELAAFDWNCPQHITPRIGLE